VQQKKGAPLTYILAASTYKDSSWLWVYWENKVVSSDASKLLYIAGISTLKQTQKWQVRLFFFLNKRKDRVVQRIPHRRADTSNEVDWNSHDRSSRRMHPSKGCCTQGRAAWAKHQETWWPQLHVPFWAKKTQYCNQQLPPHTPAGPANCGAHAEHHSSPYFKRPFSVVLNLFLISNVLLGKKIYHWNPPPQRIHQHMLTV